MPRQKSKDAELDQLLETARKRQKWAQQQTSTTQADLLKRRTGSKNLNKSDSISIVGILVGVILVILAPNLAVKIVLLLAVCIAIWFFVKRSHWSSSWSEKNQKIASLLVIAALLAVAIPQFVSQSTAQKQKRANMSLLYVGPISGPATGLVTEARYINDSDFPAYDELARFQIAITKLQNGNVSRDDQEKAYSAFDRAWQSTPPTIHPKTVEPHEITISDTIGKTEIPREIFDGLATGKWTPLFIGAIVWKDDGGPHRKEFCKWIVPPAFPEYTRISELHQRDCYSHNGLLY